MIGILLCALNLHRYQKKALYPGSWKYPAWTPSSCGWHEHRYCERCHEMQIRYRTNFPNGAPGIVFSDQEL